MVKENVQLEGGTVLVTGAAGFIGANLVKRLLNDVRDVRVVGVDSMTDYYDVGIKELRLREIETVAARQKSETAARQSAETTARQSAETTTQEKPETETAAQQSAETELTQTAKAEAAETMPETQEPEKNWTFVRGDISASGLVEDLFSTYKPSVVVNLAAQAGVRYSITNPDAYISSNIIGFYNILEACRRHPVAHLVYASSSSVYGSNAKIPYSTADKVDNPVSLYAATKKSNELMAHAYSKLYAIPSTGLRFFTVYGPAGRPDMAYFGFTDTLRKGLKIKIFNYGNCRRDFTYIDDIVEGVVRVMRHAPELATGADGLPVPPYRIYNIGNSRPESLLDFVNVLQEELVAAGVLPADFDFEGHKELVPMQPGDVPVTFADTSELERDFGFRPSTPLREGLRRFANWYAEYYGLVRKDS